MRLVAAGRFQSLTKQLGIALVASSAAAGIADAEGGLGDALRPNGTADRRTMLDGDVIRPSRFYHVR